MSQSTTSNRVNILKELENCTGAVTRDSVSTVGRKTFTGRDSGVIVAKLARAFAMDCTVKEACNIADISRDAFYRYCKKYPQLRNTLDNLRMTPTMSAKKALIDSIVIHGNWKAAFKYLEVHCPEEYGRGRNIPTAPAKVSKINITVRDDAK